MAAITALQVSPPALAASDVSAVRGDGSEGFVLNGIDETDACGDAVSGAGDLNGDGVGDFVIGARHADPHGRFDAGESYVVFGRTTTFPPVFPLRNLLPAAGGDGGTGFVLNGIDEDDASADSVSYAGDVNGDEIGDLIIGARGADPGGHVLAGESYVLFGRTTGFPAVFELRSLLPNGGGDGSAGFVLRGIDANDFSGVSVSAAGDVNGDGIDDLIIGAYFADPHGKFAAGESYVVFGRRSAFPAALELRSLLPEAGGDGSQGFVLRGIDDLDYAGNSVSTAGDVNGDGIDDLIIGAYGADPNGRRYAGESYVVFGRTTGFPAAFELGSLLPPAGGDGSAGFVLRGNALDYSGAWVSTAGDVNNDGIGDVLIGGWSDKSYVVFGRATGFPAVFELSGLADGDGSAGFVLKGLSEVLTDGSGGGDVNGDGIGDLIVGVPHYGDDIGQSYVVFGGKTRFPPVFELGRLLPDSGGDGSAGFVLNGARADDLAGWSVSHAGDVNGDSIDDLIIGAPTDTSGLHDESGHSYVVFGRTTGFPAVFELRSLFPF